MKSGGILDRLPLFPQDVRGSLYTPRIIHLHFQYTQDGLVLVGSSEPYLIYLSTIHILRTR